MPRGGAREGSGRKKLSESGRKSFALSFQQEQIDYIKEMAEKYKMNYSALVLEAVRFYGNNKK